MWRERERERKNEREDVISVFNGHECVRTTQIPVHLHTHVCSDRERESEKEG
jgi:hypothetical protein